MKRSKNRSYVLLLMPVLLAGISLMSCNKAEDVPDDVALPEDEQALGGTQPCDACDTEAFLDPQASYVDLDLLLGAKDSNEADELEEMQALPDEIAAIPDDQTSTPLATNGSWTSSYARSTDEYGNTSIKVTLYQYVNRGGKMQKLPRATGYIKGNISHYTVSAVDPTQDGVWAWIRVAKCTRKDSNGNCISWSSTNRVRARPHGNGSTIPELIPASTGTLIRFQVCASYKGNSDYDGLQKCSKLYLYTLK